MSKSFSKILAINGSHRSEKGFTEIVLEKFIKGAESTHAQCEIVYPSKQKITPCASCGKCLFETPGLCKYKDDMESISAKMEEADLLVFASPVYFDSMSSNMKKMFERLRPSYGANFEFRNGRTYHVKSSKKHQKAVIICTAGNPERESFVSISRIFNRIINNMGGQLAGEFHFPASHLLVTEPERLTSQLEAVTMAGKEFASGGTISRELLVQGNKEYIDDPEAVVQEITEMILEMRKNHSTSRKKL